MMSPRHRYMYHSEKKICNMKYFSEIPRESDAFIALIGSTLSVN
jgi:hypothetical protein